MTSTGRLLVKASADVSFVVSTDVLPQLTDLRQMDPHLPESGGLLLGRLFGNGNQSAVEDVTVPGKGDRQSRFSFFRSTRHQRAADKYWKQTGGEGTYLGLWHTHPEPVPNPSGVDMEDWRRALKKDLFHGDGLLFTIVGTKAIGFWYGTAPKKIEFVGNFEMGKHVKNLSASIDAQ
jgi:integrative and conjugative element protein (TIGR02256 family)